MARESTITQEQVSAAADSIKAQGGKATSRAVREVLGSGSMATVCKFLQQWQGGQVRQSQTIDDTLDPAIVRVISNQISIKVQEATADATVRLADLQAEAAAIITENERQAADLDAQATELESLTERHAALAGRYQQLEDDAARTAVELVAERAAAELARVSLAKAELRLEAVPRIEAEIVAVRVELAAERVKSAEQHEKAAVAVARFEAEAGKSKQLELQLAEAIRRADEATKRALVSADALSNERMSVQASQARLEAAAREITAANESAGAARAAAKKSGEEAAELRGQLSVPKVAKKPV